VKRWRTSDLLVVIAVALIYIGCAKLGLALAFQAAQVTAVWPPTGFALAAVLLLGRRSIPGILIGALLANATAQEPLTVAAGIAIGNTLEAVVGAMLLRRLSFDGRLARVRDVMALLVAVVVSPVVSATIGVAARLLRRDVVLLDIGHRGIAGSQKDNDTDARRSGPACHRSEDCLATGQRISIPVGGVATSMENEVGRKR